MLAAMAWLPAQAGILIEPFIGYEMSDLKGNGPDDEATGTNMGLRLGMTTFGFMYGGEYSKGSLNVEYADGSPDDDLDTTDIGLFIGYEFPIRIVF